MNKKLLVLVSMLALNNAVLSPNESLENDPFYVHEPLIEFPLIWQVYGPGKKSQLNNQQNVAVETSAAESVNQSIAQDQIQQSVPENVPATQNQYQKDLAVVSVNHTSANVGAMVASVALIAVVVGLAYKHSIFGKIKAAVQSTYTKIVHRTI